MTRDNEIERRRHGDQNGVQRLRPQRRTGAGHCQQGHTERSRHPRTVSRRVVGLHRIMGVSKGFDVSIPTETVECLVCHVLHTHVYDPFLFWCEHCDTACNSIKLPLPRCVNCGRAVKDLDIATDLCDTCHPQPQAGKSLGHNQTQSQLGVQGYGLSRR
jgi:hypothetical protein